MLEDLPKALWNLARILGRILRRMLIGVILAMIWGAAVAIVMWAILGDMDRDKFLGFLILVPTMYFPIIVYFSFKPEFETVNKH